MFNEMKVFKVSDSLYKSLLTVGATADEAQLYLRSMSLGPSTLSSLAKTMGWSRPKLYSVIDRLKQLGLVSADNRKRYTRRFFVGSPTMLLELVQKKNQESESLVNELVDMIPAINRRLEVHEKDLPIRFVRGADDMREFFRELNQNARGELIFLGSIYGLIKILTPATFVAMQKLRSKKNVFVKTLVTSKFDLLELKRIKADGYRECRVLKNVQLFDASLHISGDRIYIWDVKSPSAVVFKSHAAAEMIKSIFHRLWVLSECTLAVATLITIDALI